VEDWAEIRRVIRHSIVVCTPSASCIPSRGRPET
jgi:hypothetical protein